MRDEIERRIRDELKATHVQVIDESARHAGHAGSGGGGHYIVTIVSPTFAGKNPVERQRLVYGLFDRELRSGEIHALSLTTKAPGE